MPAMPHEHDVIGQVKQPAHRFVSARGDHRVVEIEQVGHTSEQPEDERGREPDPARHTRLDFGELVQADDRRDERTDHKHWQENGRRHGVPYGAV